MPTGFVIFTASRPLGWPMLLVNINTVVLSAIVIYLGFLGLHGARVQPPPPDAIRRG